MRGKLEGRFLGRNLEMMICTIFFFEDMRFMSLAVQFNCLVDLRTDIQYIYICICF